jgi:hypothetical protein
LTLAALLTGLSRFRLAADTPGDEAVGAIFMVNLLIINLSI